MASLRQPRTWLLLAGWLAVLLACQSLAVACPNCKDALAESDPQHLAMVRGYFWSIIFMVSMPFLILSGLCTYFYLEVRRARRLQNESRLVAISK
jgi:heme/copper-type cytochrome/quinol oxidase subunit 2